MFDVLLSIALSLNGLVPVICYGRLSWHIIILSSVTMALSTASLAAASIWILQTGVFTVYTPDFDYHSGMDLAKIVCGSALSYPLDPSAMENTMESCHGAHLERPSQFHFSTSTSHYCSNMSISFGTQLWSHALVTNLGRIAVIRSLPRRGGPELVCCCHACENYSVLLPVSPPCPLSLDGPFHSFTIPSTSTRF
jgi:hypothetical protein